MHFCIWLTPLLLSELQCSECSKNISRTHKARLGSNAHAEPGPPNSAHKRLNTINAYPVQVAPRPLASCHFGTILTAHPAHDAVLVRRPYGLLYRSITVLPLVNHVISLPFPLFSLSLPFKLKLLANAALRSFLSASESSSPSGSGRARTHSYSDHWMTSDDSLVIAMPARRFWRVRTDRHGFWESEQCEGEATSSALYDSVLASVAARGVGGRGQLASQL